VPNQNCTAPSPSCNVLAIRSECGLACNYFNTNPPNIITIPASNYEASAGAVPANTSRVVELSITRLYGFYNIDDKATRLNFYVDAGDIAAQALECAVSYDWTSDGTWDRVEMFDIFPPNDVVGFELMRQVGLPIPAGQLLSVVGDWNNLENGTVRIQLWSAFASNVTLMLRTDQAEDSQESYLTIPFITSFWAGDYGNGTCMGIPLATTGDITTGQSPYGDSTSGQIGSSSESTSVVSSSASTSYSSTGSASCDNYPCSCHEQACDCVTMHCALSEGIPTCVATPKANNTVCNYSVPPVCFTGTCVDGLCAPVNGLSKCEDNSSTDANQSSTSSQGTTQSTVSVLLVTIAVLMAM
jgi:hypothetical protein